MQNPSLDSENRVRQPVHGVASVLLMWMRARNMCCANQNSWLPERRTDVLECGTEGRDDHRFNHEPAAASCCLEVAHDRHGREAKSGRHSHSTGHVYAKRGWRR